MINIEILTVYDTENIRYKIDIGKLFKVDLKCNE